MPWLSIVYPIFLSYLSLVCSPFSWGLLFVVSLFYLSSHYSVYRLLSILLKQRGRVDALLMRDASRPIHPALLREAEQG